MALTLMIIGAGPNQLPAINLAKSKGYTVVVTDYDPNAVGFAAVDDYAVVSTRDVEATVTFAKAYHQQNHLTGVMTMASESAVTVASVAKALGLPGVNLEAAYKATHKITRQQCFVAHGVPAPRYAKACTVEGAIASAEKIGWPVVLKPSDSAGSRGVQLVKEAGQLKTAIEEIRSISKDRNFLLEEYLEGTEHSIEGIVIDGEVYWTAFSDRNYDKKHLYFPFFMEDGDTLPSVISTEMKQRVKHVSTRAVQALGIDFGPVKGDILIDEEGPKVIEMAARLSGDYFCYETAPLHNGINLLEIVMDQAMGIPIDHRRLQPQFSRGVALRYVWPKPGVVNKIEGVEEVRNISGVRFFNFEPKWKDIGVGTVIHPARSMGERVGSVLVSAKTREEAVQLAEECVGMVKVETE